MKKEYTLAGKRLISPLGNGAGTVKTVEEFEELLRVEDIGIITIGSITMPEKPGNEGNTFHDGGQFTLNSLGLPNPGIKYWQKHLKECVEKAHDPKVGKLVCFSIVGDTPKDYAELAMIAEEAGVDFIELNTGCPNLWDNGKQKEIICFDGQSLHEVLAEVIEMTDSVVVGVKLSPYSNPAQLSKIANLLNLMDKTYPTRFKFVVTCNTFPNCSFNDKDGEQVITPNNGLAGMAGDALFPIAKGQVEQFRKLLTSDIDVVSVGGINSGERLKQMLDAGASSAQVVSAYYANKDTSVFPTYLAECSTISDTEESNQ